MRFYTILPSAPPELYPEPPLYRKIVGLEWQGKSLYLPDIPELVFEEDFKVPNEIGDGIFLCFEHYYIKNPTIFRDCHVGALAMTRGQLYTRSRAFLEANYVISMMRRAELPLAVGAWAVKVFSLDGGPPLHSIVGFTENTVIQIDNTNADMSLAGYSACSPNFAYYAPRTL